jgi:hypothetical protein
MAWRAGNGFSRRIPRLNSVPDLLLLADPYRGFVNEGKIPKQRLARAADFEVPQDRFGESGGQNARFRGVKQIGPWTIRASQTPLEQCGRDFIRQLKAV